MSSIDSLSIITYTEDMKITQEQQEKLNKIGKEHNIKLAMIIGSRTEKGSPKPNSDLDVAFILNAPERKYSYIYGELYSDLSDVFPEFNVDIVNLKNTNFVFRYEVYLNSELIIGNELDYSEFLSRSYKEFMDSRDLLRLRETLLKKHHNMLKQKIYA